MADFIIVAVIVLAVFFAVRTYRKNIKGGCSCGCGGCANKSACEIARGRRK